MKYLCIHREKTLSLLQTYNSYVKNGLIDYGIFNDLELYFVIDASYNSFFFVFTNTFFIHFCKYLKNLLNSLIWTVNIS